MLHIRVSFSSHPFALPFTTMSLQLVAGLESVPYSVMKAFVERLDPAIMCEMAMMSVFKVGVHWRCALGPLLGAVSPSL